jgi:hypothetical protein
MINLDIMATETIDQSAQFQGMPYFLTRGTIDNDSVASSLLLHAGY